VENFGSAAAAQAEIRVVAVKYKLVVEAEAGTCSARVLTAGEVEMAEAMP